MLSKTVKLSLLLSVMLLLTAADAEARKWTLAECIDYALKNNITLQKLLIAKQSATEDVLFSKAALRKMCRCGRASGEHIFAPFNTVSFCNPLIFTILTKVFCNRVSSKILRCKTLELRLLQAPATRRDTTRHC